MDSNYKQIREDFIRGHNGSTVEEVIAITVTNQLSNFLLIAILSLFPSLTDPKLKWIRYPIEFLIIFLPFLLCVTALSNHIYSLIQTIISLIVFVIILCFIKTKPKTIVTKDLLNLKLKYGNPLPFATNLMSNLLICVCVAILAVDFKCFSRRFAKTEIYGWSLMDVGVGGFIAINGGLSPESRLGTNKGYKPMFLLKKTLLATIPLFVLGFQRLIAVKSLEYHEHITEYGLHWNFFFTLALTKIISTTICCLFTNKLNIGFIASVLLICHQICLSFGLNKFIQNDDRNGLFAANKEGIISMLGYISLYLIFVEIGRYLLTIRNILKEWLQMTVNIFFLSLIFSLIMSLSHTYIESVSRRETNLAFISWMTSLISILIALELFIQAIIHILEHLRVFGSGESYKSILFSSIGYSGLLIFLVSNLLTGLVNFTIDTISASDSIAFVILIIYCLTLSFVAVFCAQNKIQLKFPLKYKSQ